MIKKFTDVSPGVKRPIRVEDMQQIWGALAETLAQGTDTVPVILCGFEGTTGKLTSGVIASKGQLYTYDETEMTINVGDSAYAKTVEDSSDIRTFDDGSVHAMYYNNIVNNVATGGTFVGVFSVANIDKWRLGHVASGSITNIELADGSVTNPKIANGAVWGNKIAPLSIDTSHINAGAVKRNNLNEEVTTLRRINGGTATFVLSSGSSTRSLSVSVYDFIPSPNSKLLLLGRYTLSGVSSQISCIFNATVEPQTVCMVHASSLTEDQAKDFFCRLRLTDYSSSSYTFQLVLGYGTSSFTQDLTVYLTDVYEILPT